MGIEIHSPKDGEVVNGNVYVTGMRTECINAYVESTLVGRGVISSLPFTIIVDTTRLANGPRRLTIPGHMWGEMPAVVEVIVANPVKAE